MLHARKNAQFSTIFAMPKNVSDGIRLAFTNCAIPNLGVLRRLFTMSMLSAIPEALAIWTVTAAVVAFVLGAALGALAVVPAPAPAPVPVRSNQSSESKRSEMLVNS
jgi:hypothetical protein